MSIAEIVQLTDEQYRDLVDVNQMGRNIMTLAEVSDPSETNGELEHDIEYLSFSNLVNEYHQKRDQQTETYDCSKLIFTRGGEEISDMDGYNMTQPIYDIHYDEKSGKPYYTVAVRVEKRDDETDSTVDYFRADSLDSKIWDQIEDPNLLRPKGQDPAIAWIGDELVLSVVEVESIPNADPTLQGGLRWKTVFYKGQNISNLERFAEGPQGMKDIRLVQLPDGKITVFTRPQDIGNEERGGHGQIGVVTIDSIDQLKDPDILQNAPIINTRFQPGEEWGGVNQAIALNDGRIGLLFHIGRFDPEDPNLNPEAKEYVSLTGFYNPTTKMIEYPEVVAEAHEFEGVQPKSPRLRKVAFGSAMGLPDKNGIVRHYFGAGDSESWHKDLKDRFADLRIPDHHYPLAA
jgi:hypothetical protein